MMVPVMESAAMTGVHARSQHVARLFYWPGSTPLIPRRRVVRPSPGARRADRQPA